MHLREFLSRTRLSRYKSGTLLARNASGISYAYLRSIAKAYYKGAVAALLVYDITDEHSFDQLEHWYKEISS